MVDTDILLSNARRFRELPIEARHSICLEIAKRRRQSVATSIFIPKELSRKLRQAKSKQRREKLEATTMKQTKLKIHCRNKYNCNKAKCMKNKEPRKQPKLPVQIQCNVLKHPESYPIVKPIIPREKVRSVLESLLRSDHEEERDEGLTEENKVHENEQGHQAEHKHEHGKEHAEELAEEHQEEPKDSQHDIAKQYHDVMPEPYNTEIKLTNLKKEDVQLEYENVKEILANIQEQTIFTKQTNVVEEQIQLGAEQKMTISYMIELPISQMNCENNNFNNFPTKAEPSVQQQLTAHSQNSQNIVMAIENPSQEVSYFNEYTSNFEPFNNLALPSSNALMTATERSWNVSRKKKLQQTHPSMQRPSFELANIQSHQRLTTPVKDLQPMTRNGCLTNFRGIIDPHHSDLHITQNNPSIQYNMDDCQQNQYHVPPYLVPHPNSIAEQNFTQIPDHLGGIAFIRHAPYPFYFHHRQPQLTQQQQPSQQQMLQQQLSQQQMLQQQQLRQQQQQRLTTDDRPLPPPAQPNLHYPHCCQDPIQHNPLLQQNNQEQHFTPNPPTAYSTWHHPVGTPAKRTHSRRKIYQPQMIPISAQQVPQNLSRTPYEDCIPRNLQPEYLYNRTPHPELQSCNLTQNYPIDLTVPMPLPPVQRLQFQYPPQPEYQVQRHHQVYCPPHTNCDRCSIPSLSYTCAIQNPPQHMNHTLAQVAPAGLALPTPDAWLLNRQRECFLYSGLGHTSGNNNIRTM